MAHEINYKLLTIRCHELLLTEGLLNNGDGCLTTHLSDIGLFIDGRPVEVLEVDRAVSYYIDEVVDVGTNYSQMAILGAGLRW